MAVTTLLKMAGFTNDARYVYVAHQALAQMKPMIAQGLQALSWASAQPKEIAIVRDPGVASTQALLSVARSSC